MRFTGAADELLPVKDVDREQIRLLARREIAAVRIPAAPPPQSESVATQELSGSRSAMKEDASPNAAGIARILSACLSIARIFAGNGIFRTNKSSFESAPPSIFSQKKGCDRGAITLRATGSYSRHR
jgi:hypothetical protein